MGFLTTDKRTLSGYLVGIGKQRADGSVDYQSIKPVKNTIVKQGLNNWLRYNNSDTLLALSNNAVYEWPIRNIDYCLYGFDNTANDFENTTDLVQPASLSPYATKKSGTPYCGSAPFDNAGKYRFRVSHISPAASSTCAVKEIGYYTHLTNNTNVLFSRVALPFTYTLNAGEQLITTYELVINFPYSYSVTPAVQTTLKDENGVDLEAVSKTVLRIGEAWGHDSAPRISVNGAYSPTFDYAYSWLLAPIFTGVDNHANVFYKTAVKDFPANNVPDSIGNGGSDLTYDGGNSKPVLSIANYVYDSFQRDITVNLPTFWPKMTASSQYTDIYYLNFLGFALKFGHTVGGVFTPTPWRKYANHTARFVYRQTIATAESIAWQQNQ